ncbi:uncharacterized protein MEPE_00424 [Melanopsichium pennsylvanicum]|uniref:Zinc finger PHD-type domain-containing protein n=2 Tax=Melanopsichium pennsylvanicum TaxID=63383 RepID=A0AAJ5C2S5_9BASI|nr:conserved hypothetical protein [Melanopsichium pennsylvanicum 4]SNX81719.1 uncharacterized protein MEPE_00424 [Melanopsichium pennsylvanicum]
MAGKVSRSGPAEAHAKPSEPSVASRPDNNNGSNDASLKMQVAESSDAGAEAISAQAEAAGTEAAKPSTVAAQDDTTSRGSPESDDKAVISWPSKKTTSRSKKGGRTFQGKPSSSKRSNEEQEVMEDDAVDTSEAADPSGSNGSTNNTDAETQAKQVGTPAESTEAEAQSSLAPGDQDSIKSGNAISNERDDAQPKSTSTNKELAKLGSSSGDGADEGVMGPRRSRRGPGASPDLKARIPKTEPETEFNSLQGVASADQNEANASEQPSMIGKDANAAESPIEDDRIAAEDSTAPEEVAPEAQTEPKAEIEDEQRLAPEADAAQDPRTTEADYGAGEPDEADYADADDHGDEDGEEAGDEGVTRCVCGSADENVGLMIQCETCKCWQHCVCMGMQVEEDCPDVYFCEQCRPELHIPLLRSLGLLPKSSKKGAGKGAKYSARELKEAKDAIAMLAQENARRTQAAEPAATYNSRDRKSSANPRNEAAKDIPKSPKRRSTMNSRDSAYGGWEPLPPGLLADGEVWEGVDDKKGGRKRKRGLPDDSLDSAAETTEAGEGAADSVTDASKRRRMSAGASLDQEGDAEMDEDDLSGGADHSASTFKGLKKKKGNNQYTVRESSVTADSASKPRHPNQYTYRNKERNGATIANGQKTSSSSTSNLTSHSPSPSPSKGRAENARRAAVRDNGSQIGASAPGESSSGAGRGAHQTSTTQWGLPEHLTHLAYLLPNAGSRNCSARSSVFATENGSANSGKKGSSTTSSGGPSPPSSSKSPSPFQVLSSIESSTKVRFPSRRMTMGEMRKRVRNIGEYVTRSQIEAVEREKRMKSLGIVPPYLDELEDENEAGNQAEMMQDDVRNATATTGESSTEQSTEAEAKKESSVKVDQLPLSMRLMEELTRELINFQRRFSGINYSIGSSHHSATVK